MNLFILACFLFQIRSDKENFTSIRYSLRGEGYDESPFGVFSIEEKSGNVRILQILDREQFNKYNVRRFYGRFMETRKADKSRPPSFYLFCCVFS